MLILAVGMASCAENKFIVGYNDHGCGVYETKKNAQRKGPIISNSDSILYSNNWHLLYSIESRGLTKTVSKYDSSYILRFLNSNTAVADVTRIGSYQHQLDTIIIVSDSMNSGKKFYRGNVYEIGSPDIQYPFEILSMDENLFYIQMVINKKRNVYIFGKKYVE